MAEAKTFELHKKRVSIAMQQWLKTWQPPIQTRLECPFCHSLEVGAKLHEIGTQFSLKSGTLIMV